MRDTVTKSDWLHAMQCLPGAWYGLREEISAPDEAARFRMEQGQGSVLWPGNSIRKVSWSESQERSLAPT